MIHASKLFPQALKEAFEEGERARKAREKRGKRATVSALKVKRARQMELQLKQSIRRN